MYQKTPIKLNVIFYNHSVVSTFKQVTKTTTMSSPITKNVSAQTKTPTPQKKVVAKKDAADKAPAKPRKPTLKEKHSRFLVSNYSLIQFLSAKGLLTDEAVETAYSEIKMFATLEDQEAFYESYLSESKTTKNSMKKFITQRNKPPKAPRVKKERQPKEKKETAPKEKKPRAKKTTKVANDTEVDVVSQVTTEGAENLINELTAAANNASSPIGLQQQVTPEPLVQEVEPAAPQKKARKPRAKKVEAIPIALEDAESEVAPKENKPRAKKVKAEEDPPKEKKPRAKKAKKEDVVVEAPAPTVQEELVAEEEEEEIHTQEITINGTLYLIDNDNNLYSSDTHEQVGTYNTEANEVEATA
jgi:hypothetical protein